MSSQPHRMHPNSTSGQALPETANVTQEEGSKRQQSAVPQHSQQSTTVYHMPQPHIHLQTQPSNDGIDEKKLVELIIELTRQDSRESALLELSKHRESCPDLAPILWYSFGAITALLQEVIAIYPLLTPATLTAPASNRVCNSLALLQCVASHPQTRELFVQANIPLFLYPFLNSVSKQRPFEYLRLTSLGVIGALVKADDNRVIIGFLLHTEIVPLCLRIMESGSELSKTVATFILQKVLLDDTGLDYICHTAERFYALSTVLTGMIDQMVETRPSARLLKHIVRSFLRLCDNRRAREALRQCLPPALRDPKIVMCIHEEPSTKKWFNQLFQNLQLKPVSEL